MNVVQRPQASGVDPLADPRLDTCELAIARVDNPLPPGRPVRFTLDLSARRRWRAISLCLLYGGGRPVRLRGLPAGVFQIQPNDLRAEIVTHLLSEQRDIAP